MACLIGVILDCLITGLFTKIGAEVRGATRAAKHSWVSKSRELLLCLGQRRESGERSARVVAEVVGKGRSCWCELWPLEELSHCKTEAHEKGIEKK